ncbi:MAG TPA: VWA domain-containing protein [Thermoanaerobaculaceae bacterium]|nr:VWA domain-containing protein [Thermoanaerobaculaceae bacterium]HRS16716.1 VWA domain-containing protein [Thermoanaerobaculaceae bacterium]
MRGRAALLVAAWVAVGTASNLAAENTFWRDANLVSAKVETQAGTLRFVANAALLEGKNRDMVFGSPVATALPLPTVLYHNARREKVLTDLLVVLAQSPDPAGAADDPRELLSRAGWAASRIGEVAEVLDAVKLNYWERTVPLATVHNKLVAVLRAVNPRTSGGVPRTTTNLNALAIAMSNLRGMAYVGEVALGAALRAAVQADLALERLDLLERALAGSPDPAVAAAVAKARAYLTVSEGGWGALLAEIDSRRGEAARLGVEVVIAGAFKALAAKGTLGVALVVELIFQEWAQHDHAQVAVMAATVEASLLGARDAAAGESRCELEALLGAARWLHFDRMVEVTSVWQGWWVDLLSRGRPYADARAYFTEQRASYATAYAAARKVRCRAPAVEPKPTPPPPAAGAMDLIFCIDTTGSMADDIDAAKAASTAMIEKIFERVPDPRVALVAYRDHGDAYLHKGWPFSRDPAVIRQAVLDLTVGGGGDTPEAVYEALLYALDCSELGGWRDGVKKVIVLIGDAPPHTKRHTLDEVVAKAFAVDPAHVFAIAVAGSDSATRSSFGALAERTGGLVLRTEEASELPARMVEAVELGSEYADAEVVIGVVQALDGAVAGVRLRGGSAHAGQEVVFLDSAARRLVIGQGVVTEAIGRELTVEVQQTFGLEPIAVGCEVAFPRPRP